MNNDDKLREQLNSEPVPERLKPENIKKMLDEKAPQKKRNGIAVTNRIAAAAAACAVIGGTAAYGLNNGKFDKESTSGFNENVSKGTTSAADEESGNEVLRKQQSYMSGAKDYDQVYTLFEKASKKAEKERRKSTKGFFGINNKKYAVEDTVSAITDEEGGYVEEADEAKNYVQAPTVAAEEMNGFKSDNINNEPNIPEIEPQPADDPAEDLTESVRVTEEPTTAEPETEPDQEKDPEYSDTYHQEQDVLESDIVKTDGKHIYYLSNMLENGYNYVPKLRIADVKDGKFTASRSIDIIDAVEDNAGSELTAEDMYIYNDMIAVICSCDSGMKYYDINDSDSRYYERRTVVAFYSTGDDPQLIDVYQQDGSFSDVRISPDGYMLLITNTSTVRFDEIKRSSNTNRYVPSCGIGGCYDVVEPEDILLPEDGFGSTEWLSYSVIGSLDLNESGAPKAHDIKTLAGYSGSIYCSADNLYTAAEKYDGSNTTDITRISIKGGDIVPEAGCNINGSVKDQFSMSEYDGYFRVAATYTAVEKDYHKYSDEQSGIEDFLDRVFTNRGDGYYTYRSMKTDSRVYVLNMDMELVGKVEGLGEDEQLRSASFSGNMAYVVTFRQTDPLYAVDLSDPASPQVLDEFKINGFSTYMQSWGDGLLFGFGQDADDNGRLTGLRMTMFDNSDPNNLKAADVYTWNNDYGDDTNVSVFYSSDAVSQRKCLLIAPEKNLIGVPLYIEKNVFDPYSDGYGYTSYTQYQFFSFEDGKFVHKGDISAENDFDDYRIDRGFNRALYIGDYVYALSGNKFVAADINTIEITDELEF